MVVAGTLSIDGFGVMLQELITRLSKYSNQETGLRDLEDWIVLHLQETLDSGEQEAITIADELDGLLIQLSEGLVTEADILAAINGILCRRGTVVVATAPATTTVTHESANPTVTRSEVLRRVEDVRLRVLAA
jgi:hypothetical protein